MLDHQELFETGLCGWVHELYCIGYINDKEYLSLKKYIKNNKPKKHKFLQGVYYDARNSFWWTMGVLYPRIDWIEYHKANWIQRLLYRKPIKCR